MDIIVKILTMDIMDIMVKILIMDMEICIIFVGNTDFTYIKGLNERTGLRGLH